MFLSSHLLGEVQQVCDHVTILARGRCVTTGRTSDVLAADATGDVRLTRAGPAWARRRSSANAGFVSSMGDAGASTASATGRAHQDARRQRPLPHRARPIAADLEDVFLELTERGDVEGAS